MGTGPRGSVLESRLEWSDVRVWNARAGEQEAILLVAEKALLVQGKVDDSTATAAAAAVMGWVGPLMIVMM